MIKSIFAILIVCISWAASAAPLLSLPPEGLHCVFQNASIRISPVEFAAYTKPTLQDYEILADQVAVNSVRIRYHNLKTNDWFSLTSEFQTPYKSRIETVVPQEVQALGFGMIKFINNSVNPTEWMAGVRTFMFDPNLITANFSCKIRN